jgi:hypothetical protein
MKKIVLLVFIVLVLICVIPAMADTGSISVTSTPPGAQIWIDDNLQSITPYTFDGIAVGTHSVRVHLDGYYDFLYGDWSGLPFFIDNTQKNVEVTSGQTTSVEFQLVKITSLESTMTVVAPHVAYHAGDGMTGDGMTAGHWPPTAGDYFNIFITFNPFLTHYINAFPIWAFWDFYANTEAYYLHLSFQGDCGPGNIGDGNHIGCEEVGPIGGYGQPFDLIVYADNTAPSAVQTVINFIGVFNQKEVPAQSSYATVQIIPEFPSPYLPATAIIGFVGAVFLIKKTKEH